MTPRKKIPRSTPPWFITFADLMCLLMCFFVLLLSFSIMDKTKFQKVAGSMEKAFARPKPVVIVENLPPVQVVTKVPIDGAFAQDMLDALSQEIKEGLIEAEMGPNVLTLRVKDSIVFDSGRVVLLDQFKPVLDKLGKALAQLSAAIEVEGHTDNVPLKPGAAFHSNWGLSSARAVTVVDYLVENFQIAPGRMAAIGFADSRPVERNDSPEGRGRNRRVDFVIKNTKPGPKFGDGVETLSEQ